LAERLLNKPQVIEVARRNATADTIGQKVFPVDRDRKKELLTHLIKSNNWHQVLVFTRMKHGANRLVEYLEKQGISAMAIHGNKSQSARTKALSRVQDRRPASAGRHGHCCTRHRHRSVAPRGELRAAQCA
jgi:ATP-dependent RNA helicase RhlE